MKIEQELIQETLNEIVQDEQLRARILQQLEARALAAAEEARANAEPADTGDKRNVVVLLCAEEDVTSLRTLAERTTALAFQIDAEDNHNEIIPRIITGAVAFNESKRKASLRVTNLAEACDALSPKKHLDGLPKRILIKEPALVLVSTNRPILSVPTTVGEE